MDYLSDSELDSMFDEPQTRERETAATGTAIVPMPPPVPLYPLALAGAGQVPNGASNGSPLAQFATKKWGPLPAWAWLLIGGGVSAAGYLYWSSRKTTPNGSSDEDSSSRPSIGDVMANAMRATAAPSSGAWSPSRSRFAEQLERYFQKKGMSDQLTVWHDADDAKKKGKIVFVSPLINVEVKKGATVKVDPALVRFCRREGLNPVASQDGHIGLYPHSSKRGKEWEEYVDALRDEGQTV